MNELLLKMYNKYSAQVGSRYASDAHAMDCLFYDIDKTIQRVLSLNDYERLEKELKNDIII